MSGKRMYRVPIIGYVDVFAATDEDDAIGKANDLLGDLEFAKPIDGEWSIEAVRQVVQGNFWLSDAPNRIEDLGEDEYDDDDDDDDEDTEGGES